MRQRFLLGALAIVVLGLCSAASASTIVSSDFTFAFGAIYYGDEPWGLEPTGGNSEYTIGDFTLTPAPTGSVFSGGGPTFIDRTLGSAANAFSAWIGTDTNHPFSVPITASYNGAALGTDCKLTIELTNVSIYGMSYNGAQPTMAWEELTPGHSQTSPAVNLITSTDVSNPANYTKLAWNPDDFQQSIAGMKTSATRTFGILGSSPSDMRAADGIEVMGRVILEYTAVPEPSSIVLMSAGILSLLAYAWRKRK